LVHGVDSDAAVLFFEGLPFQVLLLVNAQVHIGLLQSLQIQTLLSLSQRLYHPVFYLVELAEILKDLADPVVTFLMHLEGLKEPMEVPDEGPYLPHLVASLLHPVPRKPKVALQDVSRLLVRMLQLTKLLFKLAKGLFLFKVLFLVLFSSLVELPTIFFLLVAFQDQLLDLAFLLGDLLLQAFVLVLELVDVAFSCQQVALALLVLILIEVLHLILLLPSLFDDQVNLVTPFHLIELIILLLRLRNMM